ncbi:hypothetical protein [Deinococcus sp. Leaf326]|uniref:hypothetical protein n=1 Tax=Deinococcus sp. Leaf326 TaxID=1736338 RepID=UPI0006F5031D|nr:hypothetical protein [Deinococcus sp. Leaf326]KQR22884.1 hypothetical protein ASF71_06875 [Deinococcus sp. Leaf326]
METDITHSTYNGQPSIEVTMCPWSYFHMFAIHFDATTFEPMSNVRPEDVAKLPILKAQVEEFANDYPARLARIAEISALPVVYLRLGELPEGGRSYNYREGHSEAGVSCYRAYQGKGVLYLDCVDGCDPMVMLGGSGATRKWYIISGDVCGVGSDGEPVLNNAQVVKKLTRKPSIEVLFAAEHPAFWSWAK